LQTDQLEPPQSNQAKYVLARFDSKSVIERKNPQAILNVWELVKNKLTDYNLLLKTIDLRKYASVDLIERIQNCERVQLIDEIYSEDQNASLTKGASAYVSLHRAEGLGLNILEALAADIPTVVTNYSGLSEEIEKFVFPVDYKLIPIGDNAAPYPPEGFWADPLTDSAAEQLLNAIKVRESGEWETRKKSRLLDLENYLKVAQIQTLAHVGQLLAQVDKDRVSTFRKFSRLRVNRIKTSWLAKYRRVPLPIRKLLRRIFFRYFKM
jgi:glycosyltransferase involved in cell wall biosynthesis